jgi:hypothetical protein
MIDHDKMIVVSPPSNLPSTVVEEVFDPLDYRIGKQKVKRKNNVLLTTSGGVFSGGVPVFASHYRHWRQLAHHIIVNYGNLARRQKLLLPSDRIFSSGHGMWSGGYFHWVTESLPRINQALAVDPNVVPIVPGGRVLTQVYTDSVGALGCLDAVVLPADRYAKIPNYLLVESPWRKGEFDPDKLQSMRRRIIENTIIPQDASTANVLYVSRRKARGRHVANEDEVLSTLLKFGVQEVCFEGMSFTEQVAACSRARVLISIHGAGLTNIAFMPKGACVIELVPDPRRLRSYASVRRSYRANPSYCRLAAAMDIHYSALLCEPVSSSGPGLQNILVDVNELRATVDGAILACCAEA